MVWSSCMHLPSCLPMKKQVLQQVDRIHSRGTCHWAEELYLRKTLISTKLIAKI